MIKAKHKLKTVKDYNLKLDKAEQFFHERYGYLPDPSTITEREAAEFLMWLREHGWDQNYFRRVFGVFTQFLAFSMNPRAYRIKMLTPKEIPKPIKYYALEDVRKALKMFKEEPFEELKLKTLIWIYAWTGIRYTEGIRLKYRDIDLKNSVITIEEGKGGKSRLVYIPDILKPLLEKYMERWQHFMELRKELGMDTSDFLFVWIRKDGSLLEPYEGFRGYYTKLRRRAEKVSIENFNIKKFRSTMTKLLREIGQIELDKVSAQLGHSRTETTEEFYHRMGPTGLEPGYKRVVRKLLIYLGGER